MVSAARLFSENLDLAARCAHDWRLPGADRDDVHQECLIGLWVASTSYDPARGVPFRGWAAKVIHGLMWKRLRDAQTRSRLALTFSVRANDDHDPLDLCADHRLTDELFEQAEAVRQLVAAILDLRPAEKDAVVRCINGEQILKGNTSAQNHLRRARVKLRAAA